MPNVLAPDTALTVGDKIREEGETLEVTYIAHHNKLITFDNGTQLLAQGDLVAVVGATRERSNTLDRAAADWFDQIDPD